MLQHPINGDDSLEHVSLHLLPIVKSVLQEPSAIKVRIRCKYQTVGTDSNGLLSKAKARKNNSMGSSYVYGWSFWMHGKPEPVAVYDRESCGPKTAASAQTIVLEGPPGCEEVTQYLEEECSKGRERSPGTW
jgi:hypothetical protein